MPRRRNSSSSVEIAVGDLRKANTAAEILSAAARIVYSVQRSEAGLASKPCPPSLTPDTASLLAWMPSCPHAAFCELYRRGSAIDRDPTHWGRGMVLMTYGTKLEHCEFLWNWHPNADGFAGAIEDIHSKWLKAKSKDKHPIAALVEAWQKQRVRPTVRENREAGMMPASIRFVGVRVKEVEAANLPGISDTIPEQAWLPGFEPEPSALVPAMPLLRFEAAGGRAVSRGKAASLEARLGVRLLVATPLEARHGWAGLAPFTTRELTAMLWPTGKGRRPMPPLEAWKRITQAARALGELWMPQVLDDGRVQGSRPFHLGAWPASPDRDGSGQWHFGVFYPPGSEVGPRIHLPTLDEYGVHSAREWRAWLLLSYLWGDRLRTAIGTWGSGRVKHGMHPPRLPVVERDGRTGGILNVCGTPVVRKGQPVRNSLDPAAVPILDNTGMPATERNPAMDKLPVLGPDDRIALAFADANQLTGKPRRDARQRANETLRTMERAGDLVIEDDGDGGWRILPPVDYIDRLKR